MILKYGSLIKMERIFATYRIQTPCEPAKAAEILAGEQSSGTFVPVPGETEELKQRFAAKVESVQLQDTVDQPALVGDVSNGGKYQMQGHQNVFEKKRAIQCSSISTR